MDTKTRNLKSVIDYVIVRQDSQVKTINIRVYRGPCCGTDYSLVKATFYVPPRLLMERLKNEKKNHQKCNMTKYSLYSLNDESTKILFQQRWFQKLGENAQESAETFYEHIYDCIHLAAREALGEQEKGEKGGRKNIWSEGIEAAVRRKESSYLTALSTKKPEDW